MILKFEPKQHSYTSDDNKKWTSVTTYISAYKEPFDAKAVALKSSKNKRSKWYGIEPARIQEIWKAEALRATTLGSYYHDQREQDVLDCDTMNRYNCELPVIQSIEDEHGVKVAPSQKLKNGIYPEHFMYVKSSHVCGQADLVEVVNNVVHISDYKTNKKIDMNSFKNWEGISKKMLPPLQHLEDCNFNHYALQLSFYMYMILKHNPNLTPGKMVLHHVKFETAEETDEYGFPIVLKENGEPKIKTVDYYEVPYLKKEIETLLTSKKW